MKPRRQNNASSLSQTGNAANPRGLLAAYRLRPALTRKLGIKRLRNELIRLHGLRLSVDTVHKVICRHGLNRLTRPRLIRKGTRRYSRSLPGDRVQTEVCKIGPRLYQYTAIDDCSRYQVIGIFRSRSAKSTLAFLDQLVEEMPVSIQRIQTDRGQEFFAYRVQDKLQS